MTSEEVCAREEIRDLLARYTYNGDRGEVAALAACFAEDGEFEFPGAKAVGHAAVAAALTGAERNPARTFVRHHITNPLIVLAPDGKTATSRSYFQVISNAGPDHAGVYNDRLKRTAEGWRFARRQVRVDWQASTSLFRSMAGR
jgi:3-phenylpropionate/cinnamic acid dioxygenase small subunit